MNLTLKVGDSILQNAPSPWADFMDGVGMHLRELTAEEQSIGARGLLVIQVNPKKSVGQILQTGDMVFAVNHQSVSTMEALVKALREGPALLTVSRDGQQFNVKVEWPFRCRKKPCSPAFPRLRKTMPSCRGNFKFRRCGSHRNACSSAAFCGIPRHRLDCQIKTHIIYHL